MSFSDLKKKSSNQLKNLVSELEKMNTKSFESNGDDDRYWKLTVDKAGNGHAVIRFCLLLLVRIFRGFVSGIMAFRALVVGISRTR